MTSSARLLALLTLIGLSVWLGFLLGTYHAKRTTPPAAATVVPAKAAPAMASEAPAIVPKEPTPWERAEALALRIDQLAEETDDRIIGRERAAVLQALAAALAGADAQVYADTVRYYNALIPRDAAGLMLESAHYQRASLWREAMEPLLVAAEFPESNEQLSVIQQRQAVLIEALFEEHAALEDWQGLISYFEALLLRAPNNDRIRLHLASAHARSGAIDVALDTLEITGTEAGVSQQEINALRDTLLRSDIEPIQFRAEGNALVASATLNASPIELLVDTGATKTALATSTLRRLGAYPLNETAQVMTAAGRITARLYEVPELIVEQTPFRDLVVLGLDNPPANWDGLLGMDLLRDMNVDLSNQLDTRP